MINLIYKFQPIIRTYAFSISKSNRQKTLYQVLQVPTNATATIIKKNYLKLAKIYHPDVYKGADKNRFQKIQEAYKTLSDQGDRNKYDETIGVSTSKQQFSEKPSNEGQSSYGKPNNDFKYQKPKQQINIDQQYEKFFNKKSSTHFQDIRLHEATQFKKMSQTQRIRRRFTEIYTDENLNWKMRYSKSYNQILNDQINQKNKYDQQLKQMQKENEIKSSQKYIQMRTKWFKRLIWIIFLLMLPFAYSFRIKFQLARQSKDLYQKKVDDIFADMETDQIRKRMRF